MRYLFSFVSFTFLIGCCASHNDIIGKVIDKKTKKGIENVIISTNHGYKSISDSNGNFKVETINIIFQENSIEIQKNNTFNFEKFDLYELKEKGDSYYFKNDTIVIYI